MSIEMVLSICVGIISVIALFAVSFQVYNVVTLDKRISKKIKRKYTEISKEVDVKIRGMQEMLQMNMFVSYVDMDKYDTAIMHMLSLILRAPDKYKAEEYIGIAVGVLKNKKIQLTKIGQDLCRSSSDLVLSKGYDIADLRKIIDNAEVIND